jgi:hypothetical protein
LGSITVCVNGDLTANTRGQHHHAHDAFGIDSALTFGNPNFTREATGQLGQFGRGTRM